jgi:hypothetical protein
MSRTLWWQAPAYTAILSPDAALTHCSCPSCLFARRHHCVLPSRSLRCNDNTPPLCVHHVEPTKGQPVLHDSGVQDSDVLCCPSAPAARGTTTCRCRRTAARARQTSSAASCSRGCRRRTSSRTTGRWAATGSRPTSGGNCPKCGPGLDQHPASLLNTCPEAGHMNTVKSHT